MSTNKNNIAIMTERGKSGIDWSQGNIYDDFLVDLQGLSGIRIYREMSDNDATVGSYLYAIEQAMKEIQWSVQGDSEEEKFLESCMNGMSHSWTDMIGDILSMLVFGWSYFEIVYKRNETGKVLWKKIALRKQESFDHWELSNNGSVLGMWQCPAPDFDFRFIPITKAVLFRTKLNGDNPEGKSILRTAYRSWYFKKHLEEIEAIGCERDLAGLPIMRPHPDLDLESEDPNVTQQLTWAKRLLSMLRRDEQDGVLLPAGWELELLSSSGKRQFDISATISRYSKAMASTVLAQFILLGMERTGSYALSNDLTDMFFLSLECFADSIASTFNRYAVPTLFNVNGKQLNAYPKIVHTRLAKTNLESLSNFISRLAPGVPALDIDEDVKQYLKRRARLSEYKEVSK